MKYDLIDRHAFAARASTIYVQRQQNVMDAELALLKQEFRAGI